MTDPDVQYLRSLASGYANSFINGWQTEYRHLNAIADRLESFMQAPSGQQAEPTDLKALAIQCGGTTLRSLLQPSPASNPSGQRRRRMPDPIHYLEPTPIVFKSIVVYNDNGMIKVELQDASGSIVHTFMSTGSFDGTSKLRLSMGGRVTVTREL
jgi:hypothetical protein